MKKRMVSALVIAVAFFAMSSSVADAHPGHGVVSSASDGGSFTHYVTEPFHAFGIIGSVALLAAGCITASKRRSSSQA